MDAFSVFEVASLAASLGLVLFVAAAEAGLIAISRARLRTLAGQGVPKAEMLHSYIQERGSLLRALELARIVGFVAAAVLAYSVVVRAGGEGWRATTGVVVVALAVFALLVATVRLIVARDPERWGLRLSPFIGGFKFVFGGPARLLYLPLRAVSRSDAEDDEMLRLMALEEDQGDIEDDERKMIRGVFGLEETTVREIMTPRIDIAAVDTESTTEDVIGLIVSRGFSRIPLYEKNADTIVGIIYAKDLFRYLAQGAMPQALGDLARPAFFVPESKRVDELLREMRKQRVHMAIVVDEYGGTAGLVTIEDMLEEIVGEIEDEHDLGEEQIVVLSETEALVDGRVSIDELNDLFDTQIEAEDFDTVGGCVFHLLGRMPAVGDQAAVDGLRLHVVSVDGHRVKRVRVLAAEKPAPRTANGGAGRETNGNGKRENGAA